MPNSPLWSTKPGMLNLLHIYGMMHCAQTTCTGGTGTGGSLLWSVEAMADEGGNVCQALADIARQATWLLQRYENGDVNTIENDIINPLENPTDRMVGTSAVAMSSRARASSISRPGEAVRQSLREAFPSLSGNSGKRKSDFKSKQGTRSKAPALTKKKACNVVYKDLILFPVSDTKPVPTHWSRMMGSWCTNFQAISHGKKRNLKRKWERSSLFWFQSVVISNLP